MRLSIMSRETDPLWIPLPVILVLLIINLITCINSKKDVKCFKYFFGESDENNVIKYDFFIFKLLDILF